MNTSYEMWVMAFPVTRRWEQPLFYALICIMQYLNNSRKTLKIIIELYVLQALYSANGLESTMKLSADDVGA